MKIIGLDIGEARIGAAISDPGQTTASPLEVIDARDTSKAIKRISEIVVEYEAEAIVYGLPLTMAGDEGKQSELAAAFATELGHHVNIPLIAKDERLSTREAEKMLIARGVKRDKRKAVIDKIAAAIILQAYLDGNNGEKQQNKKI